MNWNQKQRGTKCPLRMSMNHLNLCQRWTYSVCHLLNLLGKITNDEKLCWLFSRYSFSTVAKMCSCIKLLPSALTQQQKITIIQEELPQLCPDIITNMLSFVTVELSDAIGCFASKEAVILAPPVDHCYECQQSLSPYNGKVLYK